MIMLAQPTPDYESPRHHREACAQSEKWQSVPWVVDGFYVRVDDVDAHFVQAKAAGARILSEPEEAHGARSYRVEDLEGLQRGRAVPGARQSSVSSLPDPGRVWYQRVPASAAAAPKPITDSHGKIGLTSAEPGLGVGTVSPPGRVSGVGIVEVGTGGSVVSVVSVDPVLVVAPRLVLVVGPSAVVEVVDPDDVVVDGRLVVETIGRVVVV